MTPSDRIDGLQASVAIKAPCRVATTSAIALTGLQTIDGIALAVDDRVLVKDQTDAKENGIYVAASTAWSRAKDFNGARDAVQGTILAITSGTTHGAEIFKVTASDIVFGTSAITVESIGGTLATPLPVGDGGTGATTADNALTNLGGTTVGKDLFKAADAAAARTTLGLGDSATRDVGTTTGTVAAGDHTHSDLADTVARANILLNAFRIAVNGGLSVQNMVDGVVDQFADESGVDGAASTNETYDAAGDYYHNTGTQAEVSYSGSTNIGDLTDAGGLAVAWDGDNNTASGSCANGSGASAYYIGKDWGVGNTKLLTGFKVWGSNIDEFNSSRNPSMTITLQGSSDNFSADVNDLGSITFTDGSTNTERSKLSGLTSASYRYHRLKVAETTPQVFNCHVAEVEFYESPPVDMTLQSTATTADAQPDEAFIVVWQEDVDAVTLNTDLKAYASRDGGTTWTQVTLAQAANLSTGRILTGTADISGQPAGTSMKWRLTTHNTTELRVRGVGLEWR